MCKENKNLGTLGVVVQCPIQHAPSRGVLQPRHQVVFIADPDLLLVEKVR